MLVNSQKHLAATLVTRVMPRVLAPSTCRSAAKAHQVHEHFVPRRAAERELICGLAILDERERFKEGFGNAHVTPLASVAAPAGRGPARAALALPLPRPLGPSSLPPLPAVR